MLERLPSDTLASFMDAVRCPWCSSDMADATVTIGALHELHAFAERGLRWADRLNDGQAGDSQALVLCTTCGKPSILAFPILRGTHATRLLAVRTAADVAWAAHAVQRLAET